MPIDAESLIQAARAARESAYAPYSGFKVGAAALAKDGRVFGGCNVENASYSLCNCAERTALFAGVAAGVRPGDFTHIAVVADTPGPVSPCGACRQVMLEMGGPTLIVLQANLRGNMAQSTVAQLLPGGFTFDAPL
jgi:cytidine deaminase